MDTQKQIDHLIELAIEQREEIARIVDSLPELRNQLRDEVALALEELGPHIHSELSALSGAAAKVLEEKLSAEAKGLLNRLELAAGAKYTALMQEREKNAQLLEVAEQRIQLAAAELPEKITQLLDEAVKTRTEFAVPASLQPLGKWKAGEYQALDVVSLNGDSYIANETTREKPSRSAKSWTLLAARGAGGGGSNINSITDLTGTPGVGQLLIGDGGTFQLNTLTAGSNVTITNTPGGIEIAATGGGGGSGTVTRVAATGDGAIAVSGSPITTSGTFALSLASTAVTAGSYGAANKVGTFTVDGQGRLTAAADATISISTGQVTGLGSAALQSTTFFAPATTGSDILSGNGSGGFAAVVVGTGLTYAGGTLSATGGGGSGSVTSVAVTSDGDVTSSGGPITASGTFTLGLSSTSVTAGSYGAAGSVGTFTVDAKGRLTAAANTAIAITAGQVSGLGSAAFESTTYFAPATTGTLILAGNGSGGFSTVTVGSGLTYNAGTLESTAGGGSVTSVALTAGTGISISGGPITTSGTIEVTNTAPDQVVALTQGGTTTITGTYPNFTISSADQYTGTVTSVTAQGTADISVTGGPITTSGTLYFGLSDTSVTAGSYGNSTNVGQFTVDAKGRLTAAANVAISITSGQVSDGVVKSLFGQQGVITSLSYAALDTTASITPSTGQVSWDGTEGAIKSGLLGSSVQALLGVDNHIRVYNPTGQNMVKGQAVVASGSSGTRLSVTFGLGTDDSNTAETLGVVAESITNNQQGYIMTKGLLKPVDTNAFNEGDILYISSVTPGALTNVRPIAPNHAVRIGYVIKKAGPNDGIIYVDPLNGFELGELHDTYTTSVTNNDFLVYDGTDGRWENYTAANARTAMGLGSAALQATTYFAPATTGTAILAANGSGGFSDVTVGTGLTYTGGTLSSLDVGGTVTSVALTAGTGISISGGPITSSGTIEVTNTAPDQTVVLTQGGTTTITGTYPNFTISSADQYTGTVTSISLTAGVGISISGGPVTSSGTIEVINSAPDQTVVLTGSGTTSVTGTYPNFTISSSDQYTGTVTSITAQGSADISVTGGPITTSGTLYFALADTTVVAGTYGSSTQVGQFNVDAKGRLTTASSVTIQIGTTQVTGLGTAATQSTTYFAPATTGTAILAGNGSGGFSSVTVGTGLTYLLGTLSASANGTVTSVSVSGGTTGLTTSGGPITTSGTITLAGTLAATNGGTGQTSYTTGDLLYASSSSAVAKLADVATGNALLSGGVGVAPAYGKVGLTTHVSGTLPVGNGGTGATTLTGVVKGNGTSAMTAGTVALASEVSGTLPLTNGGTGQTSAQAAINSLAGATTSGQFLRGNGTNVVMSAIQAADVPTLNQNTTGTAANVTGTVAVANGGTGATTLTANNVLLGNGTSAVQVVAPGTNGNVLTSNGTTWTSAAPAGGGVDYQLFTSSGTWTKPSGAKAVQIICLGAGGGGGGGGRGSTSAGGSGGGGGALNRVFIYADLLGATETVTVGTGGTAGSGGSTNGGNGGAGGNSSFGAWAVAGGGGGGTGGGGTGTVGTSGTGGSVLDATSTFQNTTGKAISGQGTSGTSIGDGAMAEYGGAAGGSSRIGGTAYAGGSSIFGGAAGGGGGAYDSSTGRNGGAGGATYAYTAGGGGAGGTSTGNGTAGTSQSKGFAGTGGGGGAGGQFAVGNGAAGGKGAGGGGGGANNSSLSTGGSGGAGGDGLVLVVTFK